MTPIRRIPLVPQPKPEWVRRVTDPNARVNRDWTGWIKAKAD